MGFVLWFSEGCVVDIWRSVGLRGFVGAVESFGEE